MNWDAISGALPVILWILFLMLRKRKQNRTHEKIGQPRGVRRSARRSREPQEFKRDYEPIEPS